MSTYQYITKSHVISDMNGFVFVPATEAAEKVARICHGLYNWNGIANNGYAAPSGLKNLANRWLRTHTSNGARVTEFDYGDGRSCYYPDWK